MGRLRSLWARAKGQAAQTREDQAFDEEILEHIELLRQRYIRQGKSAEEATRDALRQFGNVTLLRERQREQRGILAPGEWGRDVSYAMRLLRKSPGFTAVAVGSLALGIGANTAIFSIAKHVLLDRLNVPRARDLRLLEWTTPKYSAKYSIWGDLDKGYDGLYSSSFSYPLYELLRKQNRDLSDLFAFKGAGRMDVTIDGQAGIAQSELVSGNYYQQMEVQPQLGRTIGEQDDRVAAAPVVMISDGYWRRKFNRSPSAIGKTFLLNLTSVTIVGVNPPGFTGAKSVEVSPDIFAPIALAPRLVSGVRNGVLLTTPARWWLQIMARTKPGVRGVAAQAQLNSVLQNAVVTLMKPSKGDAVPRLVVADGSRGLNEAGKQMERPLAVLLALVGLVLALACANLANLLLARSTVRQREMSVRLALGAGRSRILRQVLTESLLIALLGGALGLLLGYMGRNALLAFTADPASEAEPMQAAFSWGVFAFTAGLSLLTGLLFGLAPAWQATRAQAQTGLKDSTRTTARRRQGYGGKAVVGFQVAISMLLVTGAGMFLRTVVNLDRIEPGFAWRNLILFQVDPPRSQHPGGNAELYSRIEERLAALPGVESVSGASVALLSDDSSMDDFVPTGSEHQDRAWTGEFDSAVGTDYFTTMGIPIVAGRSFAATDTARSPRVAIVNEALSQKYFAGQNAIGKTFTTTDAGGNKLLYTIVGVCGNIRYSNLRRDPPPLFFVSYHQLPDVPWGMRFAVRTRVPPAAMAAALRAAVQSVDRDLPLIDLRTQKEQIDQVTMNERLLADLTGGFGVLALVLAALGIYGVLAYSVSRRTSEIGIRMALGARPATVLGMVLCEAAWIAAIGAIGGTAAALGMGKLVGSLLYGLKPWDPATLVGSAVLLGLVALGASWIPARRAATVDPMCALRHE